MNRSGRQLRIRQLLERQEYVDLESLCRLLETSESTIRRDLVDLERQRIVKRVHGGALAIQPREHLLDHDWQARRQADEKQRIGRRAATLIEDGQTIILDGGSTVACVAGELADRSVHAITNSLAIAQLLRDSRKVEVTLTGGYLFPRLEVMLGPLCERMLGSVAADVLVMGIGGITEAGFSNNNTLVVGSELRMIEVSRTVIIVADATKFGRPGMVPVAPLEMADIVVSDTSLAPEYREMLEAHGVQVLLA
ncbi:MAG: DeoR/GlpR family DNA-binding transcription regulator [Vicinamibacterales bacterium]|nr:DeoR/GlpR family DNA-binding transcription regulator [Vicinamibacterales bacterium]